MKLFLPKQHGAWAMIIAPYWLGVVAATFVWQHIPFFIGWVLLYLATYPFLLSFRRKRSFHLKWALYYFIPALILLLIPLWYEPKIFYFALLMIPFFIINAYFAKQNNDRALLNDFSAITSFGIIIFAVAFLSEGAISEVVVTTFIAVVLFFVCSTFYVKSMFREKNNPYYKYISWLFHIVMILLWITVGKWYIMIAFLSSLVRAIYLYGKTIRPMTLGIIEIINAVWFFIWMVVAIINY